MRFARATVGVFIAALAVLCCCCGGGGATKSVVESGSSPPATKSESKPSQPTSAQLREIEAYLNSPVIGPRLSVGDCGRLPTFRVVQVVDDDSVIAELNGETIWIDGIYTDDLVDGRSYTSPSVFTVHGTQRYVTVIGGTKQILALEAVKEASLEPWLSERRKAQQKELADKIAQQEIEERAELVDAAQRSGDANREFWNKDKSKSFNGTYVRFRVDDSAVVFEKDGKEFSTPMANLSDEDQAWIKAVNKERAAARKSKGR